MYPKMAVIRTDSVRISRMIDAGRAPRALRMPNSAVRSVTVTSMMLLTPTMPASSVPSPMIQTKRLMPPKTTIMLRTCSMVFQIQRALSSVASKWCSAAMRVRMRRSKASISASVRSPSTVTTMLSTTWSPPLKMSCPVVIGMYPSELRCWASPL